MAITILAPAPAEPIHREADSSDDSDDGGADLEGDHDMRPSKRAKHSASNIVTPGEVVTDDAQWMRSKSTQFPSYIPITDNYIEAMAHTSNLAAPKS